MLKNLVNPPRGVSIQNNKYISGNDTENFINKLEKLNITRKYQFTKEDYDYYDYIIAMDRNNLRNLTPFVKEDKENKISLMMSHCQEHKDANGNHKCDKCGEIRRNKAALDPRGQQDNMDLLIELTAKEL